MGKRDRVLPLLPKAFRKPATAVIQPTPSAASRPSNHANKPSISPTPSCQGAAPAVTAPSMNPALKLAIQEFLQKTPEAEKDAFREASKIIDEENLLARARACDETHQQSSSFRPQAEQLSKFLTFLNRFMGGLAIGIQASPEISSLVVGAVRIVIDLAIDFTTFFSRLTSMLCQFGDYLRPLAEYAKASEHQTLVQDAVAKVYVDLLDFCQKARRVFVDANGNPRKLTSLRLFLRQQWEPFEATFEIINTDMKHHLDVLSHATQALQLNILREGAQDAQKRERTRQRTSFLDWVSKIDFEESHDNIFAKKHQGTGDWLIQTKEFQDWFGSLSSAILWCYGKPGAGKSVLASNVLEHITATRGLRHDSAISFAYYNYRNSELQEPSHVIKALIKQLCRKLESIPDWLLRFQNESHSPSTVGKKETFVSLAEGYQEVFLIIDALDECPMSKRPHIIEFITNVASSLPRAKIFITSRRESDIVRAFESSRTPTIQIRAENVAADIERYVCNEVEKLRQGYHGKKLLLNSSASERRIINTLTAKADGMFLWVNLQLENLCRISEARKDHLVEAALDDLPQGLDDTYARIVERIDSQQEYMRNLALKCFSWVFYAQRPLRTTELLDALATKVGSKSRKDLDFDEVDVILEACGHLLVEEKHKIRPIHFSVQEFFTNPLRSSLQGSILKETAQPSLVHANLARVCIYYLAFGVPNHPFPGAWSIYRYLYENPFTSYAVQYFDFHIRDCADLSKDTLNLVEDLLRRDESYLAAILQIRYDPDLISDGFVKFDPTSFPISASTIIYGTHLYDVSHLQKRWASLDPPKYALHTASSVGLFNAVGRLLAQGCEVDEMDNQGVRPIYYAALRGHLSVVELLVSDGADTNTQGGDLDSPLQAAAFGGHRSTVELLISRGADVNARGGQYGNALQAASAGGYESTVELLISRGADVNTQGGQYGNALQAASAGGYESIVELLISRGADVNTQGGHYGNALQAASARGSESIVELLISRGADVNTQGGQYGNALQAASARGSESIVELLISRGADVNAQGGQYGNALQAASAGGHKSTVELLISRGADVNTQGGQYGNALQAASAGGHNSTVELLVSRGADVNAQGGPYGNALQAASAGGHKSTVELLISKGADVNAQGGPYGNALQAASAGGYESTVELLISKGADVNTQGGHYGNALQAASAGGYESIVELLISRGADVNAQGGHYGNALQAASARGSESIVELLLSKGVNLVS